jgi:glucose dehydrogenase
MGTADKGPGPPRRWGFALFLGATGAYLAIAGAQLIPLGGSAYYLSAGAWLPLVSLPILRRSSWLAR